MKLRALGLAAGRLDAGRFLRLDAARLPKAGRWVGLAARIEWRRSRDAGKDARGNAARGAAWMPPVRMAGGPAGSRSPLPAGCGRRLRRLVARPAGAQRGRARAVSSRRGGALGHGCPTASLAEPWMAQLLLGRVGGAASYGVPEFRVPWTGASFALRCPALGRGHRSGVARLARPCTFEFFPRIGKM